jgi:Tfp pilus assembly protein PilO
MSMRTRFIALVALTVVVAGAWFGLLFNPSKTKLSEVRAEVTTTRAQVAQLTAKLAELQALKKNAKELRAQAAKFTHALPSTPGVSDFIRDVQNAANEAKIDFVTVSPSLPAATEAAPAAPAPAASASGAAAATPAPSASPGAAGAPAAPAPAAAPALQKISVGISATGEFFAIERFLANMEGLKRALRINTFSIGGGSDKVDDTPLSLTLTVEVYMDRRAATATTTGSP